MISHQIPIAQFSNNCLISSLAKVNVEFWMEVLVSHNRDLCSMEHLYKALVILKNIVQY